MEVLAGTSGYSYAEWKGLFYPEKLPARDMLRHYATQLPTVEINNTFYRMPKDSTLAKWRSQVSDDFRFSVKASQRITHKKRLKDVGEDIEYLFGVLGTLGACLGVVLFQLPPWLRRDDTRLKAFLALLPDSIPAAFEFRHESWFDEPVFDLLAEHGAALCTADTDSGAQALLATSRLGYLRLRRSEYSADELKAWRQQISRQDWQQVFVYFKHEDACGGPTLARQFLETTP